MERRNRKKENQKVLRIAHEKMESELLVATDKLSDISEERGFIVCEVLGDGFSHSHLLGFASFIVSSPLSKG